MAAITQIVTGIGGSTVLDLNDTAGGGQLLGDRDGIDLADVAQVDAALTRWEASSAPVQVGIRKITLPVVLIGSSVDALATKVSALNQAVQTPWWLRVRRHGGTVDSWLRCFPTVPRISARVTGSPVGQIATGTIAADTEPYAYGARVDAGPFTVTQDTSVSTACYCDITGVTGDALTPAVIRTATTGLMAAAQSSLLAIRRRGTPSSLPTLFLQAETASTITDPANASHATTAVATACGGQVVRATFTSSWAGYTAGSVTFTWTTLSAFTGAEIPGTYRILARYTRSSAADSYRLRSFLGAGAQIGEVIVPSGGQTTMVVDLGLVQLPSGFYPQLGAPGDLLGTNAPNNLQILIAKMAAGAGTADLDWVALIPADEDAGVVYNGGADVGKTLTLDGYTNAAYLHDGDPVTGAGVKSHSAVSDHTTTFLGGVPRLAPGVTNRLWWITGMTNVGTTATPAITVSPALSVSYWPKYQWLR